MEDKLFFGMFNRRYDDIVLILNHEIKILGSNKSNFKMINKIFIDYLNNFGEKFFGFKLNLVEKTLLNKVINRKMCAIINEFLEYEDEILKNKMNQSDFDGNFQKNSEIKKSILESSFIDFFRKINNFSMRDSFGKDKQVSIKIFPLSNEISKNVITNYYYLIVRSLELEIEFAKFRNKFFQNLGSQNQIDPYFDVFDEKSSINEIKMLCAFKKKFINIEISIGSIDINQFYQDHVLTSSVLGMIVSKIRTDDFIGILSQKKFLICLFNCSYKNAEKVFKRLINEILSNSYISEKYKNQIDNIFSYNYFEIRANDDPSLFIDLLSKTAKY